MKLNIAIDRGSVQRAISNLQELPRGVRNRHMRIALNAAGGVIKRAAVNNTPKDTGLLKKSLTVKVKIPDASYNAKHHGKPGYAVVGSARKVVGYGTMARKKITARKALATSLAGGKYRFLKPSRYAHLVEGGTNRGMMPRAPLGRAVTTSGDIALAAMERKLIEGINTEAAKLAAKA